MKKFLILSIALLTLVTFGNYAYAQEFGEESTMSRQEARKAARAAHKRAIEAQELQAFNQAVESIKSGSFVIEVDQLLFPQGMSKFVSNLTNFVSMNNGNAVIQISTSYFNPGPNGLGGITVEGKVSDITMSTDKKGFVYYNFMVQGAIVSATVNIQLLGNGNRATVTVYPNFNSNNLTMTGEVVPYNQSDVFQGRTF
jgi:hypothetical protein